MRNMTWYVQVEKILFEAVQDRHESERFPARAPRLVAQLVSDAVAYDPNECMAAGRPGFFGRLKRTESVKGQLCSLGILGDYNP